MNDNIVYRMRKEKGLTQRKVGAMLGISGACVGITEKKETDQLMISTIMKYAKVLKFKIRIEHLDLEKKYDV